MQIAFGALFIFSLDTLLFDEVSLQSPQRWAKKERLGQRPVLQNLGPDTDTATLPGAVFDCWIGDPGSLDTLRGIKEGGEPQELWVERDGVGELYLPGRWVINDIGELRSELGAHGKPKQTEWSLSLSRYD